MARSIAERADVLPQLAEVFRAHGYEGATLALISDATGLGKGSLYNFFPGGKQQMARAIYSMTRSKPISPAGSMRSRPRCGGSAMIGPPHARRRNRRCWKFRARWC